MKIRAEIMAEMLENSLVLFNCGMAIAGGGDGMREVARLSEMLN
jgi:hypothetical protein